jgi:hypothetical protein
MAIPAFCTDDGGQAFTRAVLDILGLKADAVVSLDLRIAVNEPLAVRAEMLVDDDQAAAIARAFRRFEFPTATPRPDPPIPVAGGPSHLDEHGNPLLDDRGRSASHRHPEGEPPTSDGWRDSPPML